MMPLAGARGGRAFDVERVRADFPILRRQVHGKPLVYLDNAATTQKPRQVLDALDAATTRRTTPTSTAACTCSASWRPTTYEAAREKVRAFFNAGDVREIIFTRNSTEGINLVAHAFGAARVRAGDEVRDLRRWSTTPTSSPGRCCARRRAPLRRWRRSTIAASCCSTSSRRCSGARTRIVAVAHMSNALGTINPVEEIVRIAHAQGAAVLVDGSQAAYHMPVDVRALDCDFYVATGHKLYGPTGIGVLYGKAALLEEMPPFMGGGDMIRSVTFERSTWNDLPYKFEAGTPDIAGAVGLGAALDYITSIGLRGDPAARARPAGLRDRGRWRRCRACASSARRGTRRACCRSSSRASTRTTSAPSSIAKASPSAPGITARSR